MVSVSHAAHQIEATAESLQKDLLRLDLQKQALERELAAVKAHLDSVQRALGALQTVISATGAAPSGDAGVTAARTEPRPQRSTTAPGDQATAKASARRSASGTSAQGPGSPAVPGKSGRGARPSEGADEQQKYGKLTEQILDYFAKVGDSDVRARDVAEALGRATDSGSINAVRSTLDRLVGSSRIRRAGRGLYRAA